MPNSVTVNRPITRNRVCTKPGTVQGTLGTYTIATTLCKEITLTAAAHNGTYGRLPRDT